MGRHAKLSDEQVGEILTSDLSIKDLAAKFQCSTNLIWRIRKGYAKAYSNYNGKPVQMHLYTS